MPDPDAATTASEPPTLSAMCACSHHWSVHGESGRTARSAVCHGYTGPAAPFAEPCRCTGFRPWSGPRDARTGEPVRPLTMTVDARVKAADRDAQHCANCNGAIERCGHGWTHVGGEHACKVQPAPLVAVPRAEQGWTR